MSLTNNNYNPNFVTNSHVTSGLPENHATPPRYA